VHNIEHKQFDSFKLLGSTANKDNAIDQQVTRRKAAGNILFYANIMVMFSKLLTRSSEMPIYKRLLRPVVSYGCNIWILKEVVGKH
jgi:hypothetical protein